MQPILVDPQRYLELTAAVMPTPADVLRVKQVLLAILADERSHETASLRADVLMAVDIPQAGYSEPPYELVPGVPIEANAIQIARERVQAAFAIALAQLDAEGLVVPADGGANDYIQVRVRVANTEGAERVSLSLPAVSSGYRLTPGRSQFAELPLALLDPDVFLDRLDDLVDDRGRRYVVEALTAARRALWLSAVNLLGAVSEGAWYRIGDSLRAHSAQLADHLDNDRTAQVIRETANVLEQLSEKRHRTTISEIRAHAIYMRDLRNYGVHPRSDEDASLEHAFTETGVLALLMTTNRYLHRLAEVVSDLGS